MVAVPTPILGAGPESTTAGWAALWALWALVSPAQPDMCLHCHCRCRGYIAPVRARRRQAQFVARHMRHPCNCCHLFHHQPWTAAGSCSYWASPRLLASAKSLKRFEPKQLLVSEWHRRHQRRRLRHPKYSRVINRTSKPRKTSRMTIRNKYYVAYEFYSNYFYRKHLNWINDI